MILAFIGFWLRLIYELKQKVDPYLSKEILLKIYRIPKDVPQWIPLVEKNFQIEVLPNEKKIFKREK